MFWNISVAVLKCRKPGNHQMLIILGWENYWANKIDSMATALKTQATSAFCMKRNGHIKL